MSREDRENERFVLLETKVAYQEKVISDLNDVVLAHTRALDRLETRVAQLEALVRDEAGDPIGHERPPHY